MSTENAQYPLSAAAAKVETFEALNEGIWITPEALQNMEAAFAAHAEQLETAANAAAAAVALTEAANVTIAERDVTITAQTNEIAELKAEVERLKAGPAGNMSTTNQAVDEVGTSGVVGSDPINAEAARLRALKNKK